jgi:linker histone H1 and H5 family
MTSADTTTNNNNVEPMDVPGLEKCIVDAFCCLDEKNQGLSLPRIKSHLATKFLVKIPAGSTDFRLAMQNLFATGRLVQSKRRFASQISLKGKFKLIKKKAVEPETTRSEGKFYKSLCNLKFKK